MHASGRLPLRCSALDGSGIRGWLGALALALVAGLGCDDELAARGDVDADLDDPDGDPDVEFMWSGCVLLDEGRGCQRTRRPLRVWVAEQDEARRWTLLGVAVRPTEELVDGGVLYSFEGDGFAQGKLQLWEGALLGPLATLDLVPDATALDTLPENAPDSPLFVPALGELLSSQDHARRHRVAEALRATPSATDLERLARVRLARKLDYDSGEAEASAKRMLPQLEEEARLASSEGRWAERCEAALAGLHWGSILERPELHRRWGSLEEDCRGRSNALAERFDYYLGESALLQGAYAEGEARIANVRSLTVRLLPQQRYGTGRKLLDLYARTGRWSEAKREMSSLEALPLSACDQARLRSLTTFVQILARRTGEADLGDPRPDLELALAAHTRGECESGHLRVHDLAKLGADAVTRKDTVALRRAVDGLAQERVFGKYRLQFSELNLALAVFEERYDDVPALASQMAAGTVRGEPEARWRYHMLVAEAAKGRGDAAVAEAEYLGAEAVLDDIWAGVASGPVRARWIAAYRRSALDLMTLLLAAGKLEAAACAARSARVRALESPRAGASGRCDRDWSRQADEVVFLIVPETLEDWMVFVVVNERVVSATRVRAPASQTQHEGGAQPGWWDPWSPLLAASGRVRILASGAALQPALHALRWGEAPLVAQRPVSFGLDLSPALGADEREEEPDGATASVVFSDADPLRTLGRYADDVQRVTSVLEGHGWSTRWVQTPDTSTMAQAAEASGLLVYYGHGRRVGAASLAQLTTAEDVGSTALLLRDGQLWGADQVFAVDGPPQQAVLLGCDVGFPDTHSWSGGLNLAHALLLAGTTEVLAATEPLDAAMAAKFGSRLFADAAPEGLVLSEALRDAWGSGADADAEARFGALRVWSR